MTRLEFETKFREPGSSVAREVTLMEIMEIIAQLDRQPGIERLVKLMT